jgi:hypothetical protein
MKRFLFVLLSVLGFVCTGNAYYLNGQRWFSSSVTMQMNLSATAYRLHSPAAFPLNFS